MKIKEKDKRELEKFLSKQIKKDNKIVKILEKNKNNKLHLKFKVSTFIDSKTKEKKYGGSIELYETKSKNKLLDGWNLDLGATENLNVLLGISKDFTLTSKDEWSLGGYIDVTDIGKNILQKKTDVKESNLSFYIGLSKTL